MGPKLANLHLVRRLYRGAVRLVHRLPAPPGRVGDAIAGRRSATDRWRTWAAEHRTSAPLAWFHAASVGEAQAVVPIMTRLRSAAGPLQIILTCSSPSLAAWPGRWAAERVDYVPPDEPGALAAVLDALAPALLCFSRGDLWPELVAAARERAVPVAVVGGVMRPHSVKLTWPGRLVLGEMHRSLSFVGAANAGERERWIRAGVAEGRVAVTGNGRHDQVLEREADLAPAAALAGWRAQGPVLAAGSVEREDVPPLLVLIARARASIPSLRVLAVPHALDEADSLTAALRRSSVETAVWRGPPEGVPDATALVVARTGLLADLYLAGDVAYVGGGFRRGRLHSVVEPASVALPVVTGSHGADDPDLARMITAGGATVVDVGTATGFDTCIRWLNDADRRWRAGILARSCLSTGAAGKEADALLRLLAAKCPTTPVAH